MTCIEGWDVIDSMYTYKVVKEMWLLCLAKLTQRCEMNLMVAFYTIYECCGIICTQTYSSMFSSMFKKDLWSGHEIMLGYRIPTGLESLYNNVYIIFYLGYGM